MSSEKTSDGFDLERDLPTTTEDVAVLRRLRKASPPLTTEEYLRSMAELGHASTEGLRRRRGPHGEPFRLD